MEPVATRRLIDASASLGAADAALLNLWINRGLDDAALGRLTGVDAAAIASRRERIVAQFSAELSLAPEDVKAALEQIAASTERPMPGVDAAGTNGSAVSGPPTGEAAGAAVPTAALNGHPPSDEAAIAPTEEAARPRRGRLPALLGLLGVLALAIVALVVVITGGGGVDKPRPRHVAKIVAAHTSTARAVPASPTSPSPSPTVSRPPVQALAALPGGLARAGGSVLLLRGSRTLRVRLSVKGLPPAHGGHYQVWLYNSILDSVPLRRLRAGVHAMTLRLPRRARHFRWIDISFQPLGFINHSGESVLRAANPAHAGRRALRHRSARRRELRRTTGGSAKRRRARKSK